MYCRNTKSTAVVKPASVEELHRNQRGQEIVQKAILRAEAQFARKHTFRPKVYKSKVSKHDAITILRIYGDESCVARSNLEVLSKLT